MKKALVVCRTGMGSSMLLAIKIRSTIEKCKFPIELKHDLLSGVDAHRPDVVLVMKDLVEDFKEKPNIYVIGIKDIMDTNYIEQELRKYLISCGEITE